MAQTNRKRRRRSTSVLLDRDVLDVHLMQRNWTQAQLSDKAEISLRTLSNIYAGAPVQAETAHKIAAVFHCSVPELTHGHRSGRWDELCAAIDTPEWKSVEVLSQWVTAPNGLQYRLHRVEHRHIPGRFARGKFYDLQKVPERLRPAMDTCLTRHAYVCSTVGGHPNVVDNLSCVANDVGNGWWVVDRWSEASTLNDLILDGAANPEDCGWILLGILDGLLRLHECDIIFRELAPSHVLVDVSRRHVQLTDFELAKLLKDVPSVSAGWQTETAYRAPEVSRNNCSKQADYFSFGRLALRLLTRKLPPIGQDQSVLDTAGLPKGLQSQFSRCLELLPSKRLRHLRTLRTQLINWSASCQ